MFHLTIRLPHDVTRRIEIRPDQPQRLLTDVLRSAGQPLNTRCGQRSLCDGCTIGLLEGHLERVATGDPIEATDESGQLRGCEVCLPATGDATIQIPARSLLTHDPQIVTSFRINVPRAHSPLWQPLRVTRKQMRDGQRAVEVLSRAARQELQGEIDVSVDPEALHNASAAEDPLRLAMENRGDHWVIRPQTTTEPAYGAAVDVGTTTVVVTFVELKTGEVASSVSALNAQVKLGDNVLTRINLCMNEPGMTEQMQKAVVADTLMPLLEEAANGAGIDIRQLATTVVAGNTTMLHLIDGVDPRSMGVAPFTPAFLNHRIVPYSSWQHIKPSPREADEPDPSASSEASHINSDMIFHLLPGAAAYIGADITSGVLASGMAYRDETSLLIDIGTNGEIVLQHEGTLVGCATAAGPAFEGAGLSCGMRAQDGAISHVTLDQATLEAEVDVIGDGKPIGLCGTAYIDFVARARAIGLINSNARFANRDLPQLVDRDRYGRGFVIAYGRGKEPLSITEADMACLLQAKAAIAAGVQCLLEHAGTTSQDVKTVFLAGGFGFHMHVDSLLGCGLLPNFVPDQIQMVGNTSLAGAYLALLDSGALDEIRRISQRMEIIELNLDPQFEATYIDQLSLPDA